MAELSADRHDLPPCSTSTRETPIKRVLTAAVAIPCVLAITIFGDIALVLTVAVMVLVGGIEVTRMSRPWLTSRPFWHLAIPLAGLAVSAAITFPDTIGLPETLVVCWFALWLMSLIAASADLKRSLTGFLIAMASTIYLGIGAGHLLLLRSPNLQSIFGEPEGYQRILFLLAVVWAGDTAAFIVGRLLGRRPLAPRISPNKTVEGGVAGLVAAGLVAAGLNTWIGVDLPVAIAVGLIVGVFAQIGDLAESLAKRAADVKDSGTLFPGHGGLLDRVDSLIFAAPALYHVLNLVGSVSS